MARGLTGRGGEEGAGGRGGVSHVARTPWSRETEVPLCMSASYVMDRGLAPHGSQSLGRNFERMHWNDRTMWRWHVHACIVLFCL